MYKTRMLYVRTQRYTHVLFTENVSFFANGKYFLLALIKLSDVAFIENNLWQR